jgi:hypothetical protein
MDWVLDYLLWECPRCQRRTLDEEFHPELGMLLW